jgi:3-methyladenine DNA glycosylase AlkD
MPSLADALEARFREIGTPERAEGEKRYLKSDLDFLGATVWQITAAVKELAPPMTHDELVANVAELWDSPIFERRMAATVLLERNVGALGHADLPLVERLLRESKTWALVDGIAADVLGALVAGDADSVSPALDQWARDDDFWIRRSSLLAELRPIRAGAPMERFLARADLMLDEREFFIRKAIGWVLREAGKRRPEEVIAWLAPRTHRASGVTMREAVKYLPPEVGRSLMSAYREHRPAS